LGNELAIVRASVEHAHSLALTMRPADVAELAAGAAAPLDVLMYALRVSELAGTVLVGGVVAAMFGVERVGPPPTVLGGRGQGKIWLLTGHAFVTAALPCARAAQRMLGELLERYAVLWNLVDGRHGDALRFLVLLGAELGSPVPILPTMVPFVPFAFRSAP